MKIGDIVITNTDKKWIVFDFSPEFIYVVDFETHNIGEVLVQSHIKEIVSKPSNVEWMFIVKRNRNYKRMGMLV